MLLLPDVIGGRHLLIQAGKAGAVYLLGRNALGGYHPGTSLDPQQKATVGGMWSMLAYWSGHAYFWGKGDYLKSFAITASSTGALSANLTSTGTQYSGFPGSVPAVSANGTSNGIVWAVRSDNYESQGTEVLYAFDASNAANLLYSSGQNAARDNPGSSVKFAVPTITNGKVYVGAAYQVNVFGLLDGQTQAATPVMNPGSESFNPSVKVTISDSSPNAQIFHAYDSFYYVYRADYGYKDRND